jgi:hypothetical protein
VPLIRRGESGFDSAAASAQNIGSLSGDLVPTIGSVGGVPHAVQQFGKRLKMGIAAGRGKFAVEGNSRETADSKIIWVRYASTPHTGFRFGRSAVPTRNRADR